MCVAVLHGTLWVQKAAWTVFQYVWMLVLYSNLSTLETGACFTVVDASESGCEGVQTVLAVLVLLLALSDCHVPSPMAHHYNVCRFLSAMCMHALYPYSPSLIYCAFVDPTFGKDAKIKSDCKKIVWATRTGLGNTKTFCLRVEVGLAKTKTLFNATLTVLYSSNVLPDSRHSSYTDP